MEEASKKTVKLLTQIFRMTTFCTGGTILPQNSALLKLQTNDPVTSQFREFSELHGVSKSPILSGKVVSYSPLRSSVALFREGEKKEETILEVWRNNRILFSKQLKGIHSVLITNSTIARVAWSSDENYLAYIAEAKPPKKASFWAEEEGAGKDYLFRQDFGETLRDVTHPRLFIVNINTEEVKEIEVPSHVYPAQPVFRPGKKELVFVGYVKQDYHLGVQFMLNRPTVLIAYDIESQSFEEIKIEEGLMAAQMPKFSPNGEILSYFGVPKGALTHCMCLSLHIMNYAEKLSRTLIDIVHENNDTFNGIFGYHDTHSRYNWLNNQQLVFQTVNKLNEEIRLIDLDGNNTLVTSDIESPYTSCILDVWNNQVLINSSNINTLFSVSLLTFDESGVSKQLITSKHLEAINSEESSIVEKLNNLNVRTFDIPSNPCENILYYTSQSNPLIVVIHGGPHSHIYTPFTPLKAALIALNYNILAVNYRGSVGYGQETVQCLLGNIGVYDKEDVISAIDKAGEWVSNSDVISYGGSHGGYLSSFLAASGRVNQSIIVNAVTHLTSMCYNSDITDWIFAETLKSDILYNLTEEQVTEMYRRSPISVASQVSIPVLLLAGGSDARVPSFNNMELYRILKAKGTDVTMAWYPSDGHALASPASSMDLTARILLWLQDKRQSV